MIRRHVPQLMVSGWIAPLKNPYNLWSPVCSSALGEVTDILDV